MEHESKVIVTDETTETKSDAVLRRTASIQEAEIKDSRNGQFHRSFSPRQIHVR